MEYSRKLTLTLALAFSMAAAVVTAQNSPQNFVDLHNAARAAVGVGPMTWDATVAAYAQSFAEQRRVNCDLEHSPTPRPYGENIFKGGAGKDWSAADAVKLWVDEKQYYDYATNTCTMNMECRHYTQVVWSSSTTIGCARVVCDNSKGVFITRISL